MAGDREKGAKVERVEKAEKAVISRRRLLKLAAYSVPAASVLNVARATRVLAQTPLPCLWEGQGLTALYWDYDGSNPPQYLDNDTPCKDPFYPYPGDGTFFARWWGWIFFRQAGIYELRVRGQDAAGGTLWWEWPPLPLGASPVTVEVPGECWGGIWVEVFFAHINSPPNPSWIFLEWKKPGDADFSCIPAEDLFGWWWS